MIEYFLKNGIKEAHAKLISQIMLCNASKIYPRLQTTQNSILRKIKEIRELGSVPEGVIKLNQLFPFIENFCTSIDASLNTLAARGTPMQLNCSRQDIDNLLWVYDMNHSISSASTLIRLLVTLIYIKKPYVLS